MDGLDWSAMEGLERTSRSIKERTTSFQAAKDDQIKRMTDQDVRKPPRNGRRRTKGWDDGRGEEG